MPPADHYAKESVDSVERAREFSELRRRLGRRRRVGWYDGGWKPNSAPTDRACSARPYNSVHIRHDGVADRLRGILEGMSSMLKCIDPPSGGR